MKTKYIFLFLWGWMLTIFTVEAQTYVTVYTPANNPVEGFTRQEYSSAEITSLNNQYRSAYPNAILIGDASTTYNCHSYAWNISAGGTTICWINQKNASGGANISKYWSENTYMSTTEANAYKIFIIMGITLLRDLQWLDIMNPNGGGCSINETCPGIWTGIL
ncbi:MAG: hypothetical protein LUG96_13495 [Tannerellaceae bacterium]|nr:hypothetical protein [Tannerellaceae bacterium]